VQINLLTGEISTESFDFSPSLKAYCEFTQLVLEGKTSSDFDKIIIDLIFDNLIYVGDVRGNSFWWRARIHNESNQLPHVKDQIGINKSSASSGRFNAYGRGCLYLSRTRDNAFEEVQVQKSCDVSVGRFKLTNPIKVFDFVYAPISNTLGVYGGLSAFHARYFLVLVIENYIKSNNSPEIFKITQYVSRLFQKNGVAGILYKSVKDKRTDCLCLFSDNQTQYCYTKQWRVLDFDEINHKYRCEFVCEAK